ncbi:MAG: type II toxin-antitoxin system VapC family toxin [Planctomycetia bacterium]|nr:type II toxin-antitoxin system VapC family toxin [Planctomycetia bacterium]
MDASVAVKWLWPEPGEAEAAKLLDGGIRLVAPANIRTEVAGAVLRRFREKMLTENRARSALSYWDRVLKNEVVRLVPVEDLYDLAVAVSFLSRHALADCLYVAAGSDLKIPLITADELLHRRCKEVYGKIQLLATQMAH